MEPTPYAFSSPLRPSARSSAGCIFMSWNSVIAKSRLLDTHEGCLSGEPSSELLGEAIQELIQW